MVTKRIILALSLALFACSSEDAPDSVPETNAPVPPSDEPSEAKPPTSKELEPTPGDPSLGSTYPATTFVPLLDWSFESASPDCNGWPVLGSTPGIRAIPAKTGSYSCKVCADGSSPELAVSRAIGKVAKGHYALSAYVRKRVKTAAPSQAVARIHGQAVVTSDPVDVKEEWTRISAFIDLDGDTDDLSISIGSDHAEADNCLFVDDVVFTRIY